MSLLLDNFLAALLPGQLAAAKREIGKYLSTRLKQRIKGQQTVDGGGFAPRRGKGGKMMKGFARRTKTEMGAESVAVGYRGRDAKLARVHNLGLVDRIRSQTGTMVMADYPARQWVGMNADDEQEIIAILMKQFGGGND